MLESLSDSWVSKVWKPKTQHPQKLHSLLHALHTNTEQSWQMALTPLVAAATGFISLATCPIYLSFKILDARAQSVDGRDEESDQARVV